jgi:hypothetical protein
VQIDSPSVSSSEFNTRHDAWTEHYRAASERRRARGWHRRDDAKKRDAPRRLWLYVATAILFVALAAVALMLPR